MLFSNTANNRIIYLTGNTKRLLLPTRLGLWESHTNKQGVIYHIYKNAPVAIIDEQSKQMQDNAYARSADNKKLHPPTPYQNFFCKPTTTHLAQIISTMGLFWDNHQIIIFFLMRHGHSHPFHRYLDFFGRKSPLQTGYK